MLGGPYAWAVRMPYACPESARGRSWPPWRQGRCCQRPVRQHDGDRHQPRTTTWSQGGAVEDLAWRRGRAVEDLAACRSAWRRSHSTSRTAWCRASGWRRLMATDRWWPVRSSRLVHQPFCTVRRLTDVPACVSAGRRTNAWDVGGEGGATPAWRVGLLPPRRGAAVARERRRPVGGTSGAEPLP